MNATAKNEKEKALKEFHEAHEKMVRDTNETAARLRRELDESDRRAVNELEQGKTAFKGKVGNIKSKYLGR